MGCNRNGCTNGGQRMKMTEEFPEYQVAEWVGGLPTDLVTLGGYLLLADLVILGLPDGLVAVRTLFGLPLVFFVPGYAVLAALFPRGRPGDGAGWRLGAGRGLAVRERALYAFGVSIALLPVLAVFLSASGVGFGTVPVVATVTVVVAVAGLVGTARRQRLAEAERFALPVRRWSEGISEALSGSGAVVNGLLAVAVVVAVASVAYGLAAPTGGERYSGFALLTQGEDGQFEAAGYPTTFTAGDPEELVVSVANYEGRPLDYTVVVQLQRVRADGGDVTVLDRTELDRSSTTVEPGDRWRDRLQLAPTTTGEDLRLQFLLYRGEPPADPTAQSAYRHVHIWISVEGAES